MAGSWVPFYVRALHLLLASVEQTVAVWRTAVDWLQQGRGSARAAPSAAGSGSSPDPAKRLAVVFAEEARAEAIPDRVITGVVRWCHDAGVELLFLYDPGGHVKARVDLVARVVQQLHQQQEDNAAAPHLESRTGGGCADGHSCVLVGWRRGSSAARASSVAIHSPAAPVAASLQRGSMKVILLSAADAYEPALRVVRKAADSVWAGPIKTPERSVQEAGEELLWRLAAEAGPEAALEPQLILVYGRGHFSLVGYPPWQARSAEILNMGACADATRAGFTFAFQRFADVKQRFGR